VATCREIRAPCTAPARLHEGTGQQLGPALSHAAQPSQLVLLRAPLDELCARNRVQCSARRIGLHATDWVQRSPRAFSLPPPPPTPLFYSLYFSFISSNIHSPGERQAGRGGTKLLKERFIACAENKNFNAAERPFMPSHSECPLFLALSSLSVHCRRGVCSRMRAHKPHTVFISL
jgi:hypothetical protein